MERHGEKGAMRGGRKEHAGASLFGGKTMTSKSTPVAGHTTGGGVKQGHSSLRSEHGGGHAGLPGGNPIGVGSSNPSLGMADHHGPGRSGMSSGADCFKGVAKSPVAAEYHHGGHRIGKK